MVCARAAPTVPGDPDGIDLVVLGHVIAVARDERGLEYVALSDGWRRIRLDIVEGTVVGLSCVKLLFELSGFAGLADRLLTLRRLLKLRQTGRLDRGLFPVPAGLSRRIEALRVADALSAGASHRQIAAALFGEEQARLEWRAHSDFLRSRVRGRVAEARQMMAGGYRRLLAGGHDAVPPTPITIG